METTVSIQEVNAIWEVSKFKIDYRGITVWSERKDDLETLLKDAIEFNRFNQNKINTTCIVEKLDDDTFKVIEEGY